MSLRSVLEADAYDDHGAAPQPALSLTEIAYRRLEEAIVTLSLRPGAVLTKEPGKKRATRPFDAVR